MSYRDTRADERRAIGFGLVGYGFMGKAHSNALRTIPYIFWPGSARPELVAISGRTEAGVAEAASRYGYRRYSTDWNDLIDDDEVQVVDIVGPDPTHHPAAMAAVQAGKHVVCEKPLAPTAEEAVELARAADAAGVKHLTCFNYRFMPAVRLAYELVQEGALGEIHQARFRYSQEWRTNPEAALPSPVGALNIIGVHAVDQARLLVGEIASVSALVTSPVTTESRRAGDTSAERIDTSAMVVEFENGVAGVLDCSLISPGRKNQLAWEINGSRGSLAWDLENLNVLRVHRYGGTRTEGFTEVIVNEAEHTLAAPWWPSAHILGWEHGHINMLSHFVEAVATDGSVGPYGATFHDGARASQVVAAAKESALAGERVAVPQLESVG
jgi:predicted dehydrogenase